MATKQFKAPGFPDGGPVEPPNGHWRGKEENARKKEDRMKPDKVFGKDEYSRKHDDHFEKEIPGPHSGIRISFVRCMRQGMPLRAGVLVFHVLQGMLGMYIESGDLLFDFCFINIVPERKPGFFVKIKDGENFNRRNTWRILRIKI